MSLPLAVFCVLLAAAGGYPRPRAREDIPGDACLSQHMLLREEDGECYRPGERGPCPLWQTFQVDRQRALRGEFRGLCAALCPQGQVRRAGDGACVAYSQMCPMNEGYRPIKNLFGEVQCIRAMKPRRRPPGNRRLPDLPPHSPPTHHVPGTEGVIIRTLISSSPVSKSPEGPGDQGSTKCRCTGCTPSGERQDSNTGASGEDMHVLAPQCEDARGQSTKCRECAGCPCDVKRRPRTLVETVKPRFLKMCAQNNTGACVSPSDFEAPPIDFSAD